MAPTLEAHMKAPIRRLMQGAMGLDVVVEEFSAGYGIADLVGGVVCRRSQRTREGTGIAEPLDDWKLWEVLHVLNTRRFKTVTELAGQVSLSASTLRSSVLPRMYRMGLLERASDDRVRLKVSPPAPVEHIVAVEAKQHRWLDAVRQAYRYTSFANRTYVAVWNGAAARVDRSLLRKLRLGLIGVEPDGAEVLVRAQAVTPRRPKMHRYCSEALYRRVRDGESVSSKRTPTPLPRV